MQIDIAILIIIALFAFFGFRNGFVYTLVRAIGWFVALVVAWLCYSPLSEWLMTSTNVYDIYYNHIFLVCKDFVDKIAGGLIGSVPGTFGDMLRDLGDTIAQSAAESIGTSTFKVMAFLVIIIVVKLFLLLLVRMFTRRSKFSLIGNMDTFFGLLLGFFQGVLMVFLLLLVVMPISFAISPSLYDWMQNAMSHSFFAGFLFLHNPIALLVEGYSPDILSPQTWLPDQSAYGTAFKNTGDLV
ncbi:MAG: CvpA family protein [Clostridiales Family XIII bacterium]|nr:CvpA family protein [Clostridiales Family XIII bacterium]